MIVETVKKQESEGGSFRNTEPGTLYNFQNS